MFSPILCAALGLHVDHRQLHVHVHVYVTMSFYNQQGGLCCSLCTMWTHLHKPVIWTWSEHTHTHTHTHTHSNTMQCYFVMHIWFSFLTPDVEAPGHRSKCLSTNLQPIITLLNFTHLIRLPMWVKRVSPYNEYGGHTHTHTHTHTQHMQHIW